MKTKLVLVALICTPFGLMLGATAQHAPGGTGSPLMRAKLQLLQTVVEGLIQKDLGAVAEAGERLVKLTDRNDWQSHQDSRYEAYRAELGRKASRVVEFSQQKNLEGAAYAYLGVVSTCVDCHAHCRDVLRIAEETPILRPVPLPPEAAESAEPGCSN